VKRDGTGFYNRKRRNPEKREERREKREERRESPEKLLENLCTL